MKGLETNYLVTLNDIAEHGTARELKTRLNSNSETVTDKTFLAALNNNNGAASLIELIKYVDKFYSEHNFDVLYRSLLCTAIDQGDSLKVEAIIESTGIDVTIPHEDRLPISYLRSSTPDELEHMAIAKLLEDKTKKDMLIQTRIAEERERSLHITPPTGASSSEAAENIIIGELRTHPGYRYSRPSTPSSNIAFSSISPPSSISQTILPSSETISSEVTISRPIVPPLDFSFLKRTPVKPESSFTQQVSKKKKKSKLPGYMGSTATSRNQRRLGRSFAKQLQEKANVSSSMISR